MRAARPATTKAPKPESSFLAALGLTWITPDVVAVPVEAVTGVVAKVVLTPATDEADTPDGAGLAAELGTGTTGTLVTTVAGGGTTVAGGVTTEMLVTTVAGGGTTVAGGVTTEMLVTTVAGGGTTVAGGVTTETTGIVTVPGVETG
jgi:hypothetical protein